MPGNFAIRLRCPLCEADSWVTLADRRETYEQIQEQTETQTVNSSGALVMLKTKLAIGDSVFLMQKGSGLEQEVRVVYLEAYTDRETKIGLAFKCPIPEFWRRSRKQQRVPKTLRVVVNGTDSRGHPFKQSSYTVDLSQDGARLDGIGFLTSPGQTIEVRRLWRKKRFRDRKSVV